MVQLMYAIHQEEVLVQQRLEASLRFLQRANLPRTLYARTVAHLRKVLLHRRSLTAGSAFEQLADLSPALLSEVALCQLRPLLMSPSMAAILSADGGSIDPSFIKLLVRQLVTAVFSPADFIIEEGDPGNEVAFVSHPVILQSCLAMPCHALPCHGLATPSSRELYRDSSALIDRLLHGTRVSLQVYFLASGIPSVGMCSKAVAGWPPSPMA